MAKVFPADYPVNIMLRMHNEGKGLYWFYNKSSYPNDPPLFFKYILSQATSYIDIWDPYYNLNEDYNIFDSLPSNLEIRLLILKGLDKGIHSAFINNVWTELRRIIDPSKNIKFGIRVVNEGDGRQRNLFFHDRFLITDKNDVYLIGSSIGWHVASKSSTGILKITDPDISEFIISIFNEYWRLSSLYEKAVQILHP